MAWVTKSSDEQYAPEPAPREYTQKEKAQNWWHYHWMVVLVVALVAVILVWLIHDMFFRVRPDFELAYVGTQALPETTAQALEEALVPYCSDLNGDGQVVVQLNQYAVNFDETSSDPYSQLAGTTQLTAALTEGSNVYLFLLEDPEAFEMQTQALQYTDGTIPAEGEDTADWQKMVYRWSDCPVLAGLDLGEVATGESTVSGQEVLDGLYIGCRGIWYDEVPESYTINTALWAALTAGATPLEG